MTTTTLTNDDRIILLKQKIEDKRTALKGANTWPRLITNCQLTMDGIKYNLHTGGDTLTLLYLKLNALRMSAYDLQIDPSTIMLDGFYLADWMHDIKELRAVEQTRKQAAELKAAETRLNSLLSADKRLNWSWINLQLCWMIKDVFMKKYTAKELIAEGYKLDNALIKNVSLSYGDYCCMVLDITLDGDGWGFAYGGYCLGNIYPDSYDKDSYEGSAAGMEVIMRIMDIEVCHVWRT